MLNWISKNWPDGCCRRSQAAGAAGEQSSPIKNCLGKFFSSRWTIGISTAGVGSSATFCAVGEAAAHIANSTGIAGEIGRYTIPWIVMATVGGASGVVLAGSVICYCCSKSDQQETHDLDTRRLLGSTYDTGDNTQNIYFTPPGESSSD